MSEDEKYKYYENRNGKIRLKGGLDNQDVLFSGTLMAEIEFQRDLNTIDVLSVFKHYESGLVGAKSIMNLNDGDWTVQFVKVDEKQKLIDFFGFSKEAKELYDKLDIKHEIEI